MPDTILQVIEVTFHSTRVWDAEGFVADALDHYLQDIVGGEVCGCESYDIREVPREEMEEANEDSSL